jgi:hypothetical protein
MMQMIINDPLMKKAFYSQPTLWNVITSAMKGEKPRGKGIVSARDIIGKYKTGSIRRKIGKNADSFKMGRSATFKFIEEAIMINPTGQPKDKLELPITSTYRALVQNYQLNDKDLVLSSKQPRFKLIIKKEIEGMKDAYEVTVVKEITTKIGVKTYNKDGKVQFISAKGTGYYNEEKDNQSSQQVKNN